MQLLLFSSLIDAVKQQFRPRSSAAAHATGTSTKARPAKTKPANTKRRAQHRTAGPAVIPPPSKPLTHEQQAFETLALGLLAQHQIEVRRYRQSLSGCAYELRYRDGRLHQRCIEVPAPRTQLSLAVFLHEIGHHAIGFNRYKPRCLEEFHAWKYAIDQMTTHGITIDQAVHDRMTRSLRYAVLKAVRRGIRRVPRELLAFVPELADTPLGVVSRAGA
jgi:hypothetical protein